MMRRMVWSWVACMGLVACEDAQVAAVQRDAAHAADTGGKADDVVQQGDAAGADGARVDPDAALADAALADAALADAALADATSGPDAALPDAALPDASPPDGRLCGAAWLEAVTPLMAGLYFLSESDYPLDPVLVEANLGDAVGPEDALALFQGPAGAVVETRAAEGLRDRLTLDFDPADPASIALADSYARLFAFLDPQLDAELVVRVSEIEVHVYYLGRTACGELAGFHTVSVET